MIALWQAEPKRLNSKLGGNKEHGKLSEAGEEGQ